MSGGFRQRDRDPAAASVPISLAQLAPHISGAAADSGSSGQQQHADSRQARLCSVRQQRASACNIAGADTPRWQQQHPGHARRAAQAAVDLARTVFTASAAQNRRADENLHTK